MTHPRPDRGLPIPEESHSPAPPDGEYDYDAFEAGEVVGRGGNATVYAATLDGDPGRRVALKEPSVGGDVSRVVADRFHREAETWSSLDDHPHVVTVYAHGTDPHPWIALEYVDGGSLASAPGDIGSEQALWSGACVATAIDHAHRAGVAHLDLTPTNVLLRTTNEDTWPVPAVADWGLARALRPESVNLDGLSPRYGAPEQFDVDRYGPIGPATDVYQLGVVLYELLTGTVPFEGPPRVLRAAVLEETPPAPSGRTASLSTGVDEVLDRALAKDPAERYGSMYAFRRALETLIVERTGYDPEGSVVGPVGADLRTTPPETPTVDRADTAGSDSTGSPYERALDLAEEGFVQLSEAYFARRDPAPPLEAWRRGVTLADVRAGRAVERTVPADVVDADGDERLVLVDRLVDGLADGTDHAVLGPPGSGKSTVCKQVACEWFDRDHGPVFYRESGGNDRFERPVAFARRVTATDGHALVVVEDAVRPEANAVFEFFDRIADDPSVTVLLDARENEWHEAGDGRILLNPDPVAVGREALELVYVPRPDRREHERFVRAVDAATEGDVDVDVEELQAAVERAAADDPDGDGTRPGGLFYLLHRLTALARDPLAAGEGPTSLTDAVADVYERLGDVGDRALDVGVCANALNAAGIGVHPELLYAVVPAEPIAVDDAVEVLDGRVLFPRETDWSEGVTAYPAVHEAWSTAFLAHAIDSDGEAVAAERFGRVVGRVLSLADDEVARERVRGVLAGDAPYLARIERDPWAWADEVVETVFALGRERPKLAPLFGDGERDSIDLPGACSARIHERRSVWLGRMFLDGGHFDPAERAFERIPIEERAVDRLLGMARVAKGRGELDAAVAHAERCLELVDDDRPTDRARVQLLLGRALSNRGDFEAAHPHLRAALDHFVGEDDYRQAAETLDGMGIAAAMQNEYDRARDHLERSLEFSRRVGDRRAVANTFNNLGEVTRHQGEDTEAREFHERSLDIRRELGDHSGQASSLNNLGVVAVNQGAFDRAREYYERSLETARTIGYSEGEMNAIANLGNLLRRRGEYELAREYQRRGLETARDLSIRRVEVATLTNLGEIARYRGEYERARDRHEDALSIAREFKFRYGEALNRAHLGALDEREGDLAGASEHLEAALDVATEIGEPEVIALAQYRLGEVARRRGDHDDASERFERATDALAAGENPLESARVDLARGRLALDRGDLDRARERARAARETFGELDAAHWRGRSRLLCGRLAAAADDLVTAREHWRAALDAFEDVGAPQDALDALILLVENCGEQDDDAAEQWCRRASQLLGDTPEPVAEKHREWIDRTCASEDA